MEHIPDWALKPQISNQVFLQIKASPEAEEEEYCIDGKAAYLIGRNGKACDFSVPEKSASRVHACIAYRQQAGLQVPVVKDLDTSHGTFVNGERLDKGGQTDLKDGDGISIGAAQMTLRLSMRSPAAAGISERPTSVLPPQSLPEEQNPSEQHRSARHKHRHRHKHRRSRSSSRLRDSNNADMSIDDNKPARLRDNTAEEVPPGSLERHNKRHRSFSPHQDAADRFGHSGSDADQPAAEAEAADEAARHPMGRRKHSPIPYPGSADAQLSAEADPQRGLRDSRSARNNDGTDEPGRSGGPNRPADRSGPDKYRSGRRGPPDDNFSDRRTDFREGGHDRRRGNGGRPENLGPDADRRGHREASSSRQFNSNGGLRSDDRHGDARPAPRGQHYREDYRDDFQDNFRGGYRGRGRGRQYYGNDRLSDFDGPDQRYDRHPSQRGGPSQRYRGGPPRDSRRPPDASRNPSDYPPNSRGDASDIRGARRDTERGRQRDDDRHDRQRSSDRRDAGRPGKESGFSRQDDKPAAEVAKDPGELVRQMMGAPGGGPTSMLTADAKKKLLWGKKPAQETAQQASQYGANNWNQAEFETEQERERFQKLMGVKTPIPTVPQPCVAAVDSQTASQHMPPGHAHRSLCGNLKLKPGTFLESLEHEVQQAAPVPMDMEFDGERNALGKLRQQQMLDNMELEYRQGLRRKDGRTVGLGL